MPRPWLESSLTWRHFRVDLHIHLGKTPDDNWAKIPAARDLTLSTIPDFARRVKGLHAVGIVDIHIQSTQRWLARQLESGACDEEPGGGYRFSCGLVVILGCEMEVRGPRGSFHIVAYLPHLDDMRSFTDWLRPHVNNPQMSSPMVKSSPGEICAVTRRLGGKVVIAHAFTPHKGFYGTHESIHQLILDSSSFSGVELGLSSDTSMARPFAELEPFPFITSSDAHSLERIGREFTLIEALKDDYQGIFEALGKNKGRIVANYGLYPSLGKYYRTECPTCGGPAQNTCYAQRHRVVKGVTQRLEELVSSTPQAKTMPRPPYIHQLPLPDHHGMGKRRLQEARRCLGHDHYILHEAAPSLLAQALPKPLVRSIMRARQGQLTILPGGGGRYGRVQLS